LELVYLIIEKKNNKYDLRPTNNNIINDFPIILHIMSGDEST